MGKYLIIVNHTKRQRIEPLELGDLSKFGEFVPNGDFPPKRLATLTALATLLLYNPHDGRDPLVEALDKVRGRDPSQAWAGDRISILGDGDPGFKDAETYLDITPGIRSYVRQYLGLEVSESPAEAYKRRLPAGSVVLVCQSCLDRYEITLVLTIGRICQAKNSQCSHCLRVVPNHELHHIWSGWIPKGYVRPWDTDGMEPKDKG